MTLEPDEILSLLEPVESLNLFPMENRMSPRAIRALAADAVHRYPGSEADDHFFGDVQGLRTVFDACVSVAKAYFGASYACISFLSGLQTMHAVVTALCRYGDRVLVLDPRGGGHYATATICEGYGYDYGFLPFDRESCLIDTAALESNVSERPPRMVYLDCSHVIRLPRIAELRRVVGPDPYICLDASHIFGILLDCPEGTGLEAGASSCSGSTHKTLPGPQKGMFLTNDATVAEKLEARLPFVVSNAHSNSVAALAITLAELMPHRYAYAAQVRRNARAFGRALHERGFDVQGASFGFTETHQVWVAPPIGVPGKEWGKRLCSVGVRSTTVALPTNRRLGVRLGVQELTRLGMREEEMDEIASIFERVLLRDEASAAPRDIASLNRRFRDVQFITARSGERSAPVAGQLR